MLQTRFCNISFCCFIHVPLFSEYVPHFRRNKPLFLKNKPLFPKNIGDFLGKVPHFLKKVWAWRSKMELVLLDLPMLGGGKWGELGRNQGQMGVQAITITTNALIAAFLFGEDAKMRVVWIFFVGFCPIYNFWGAYLPIYFREAIVLARDNPQSVIRP